MAAKWTDEKAKGHYEALIAQLDNIFKVPPEIARAEPQVFASWMYNRQCQAAHLRIEAAHVFLNFTKAP